MKILYVTFEKPSKYYGGGICIIQSLESIGAFGDIDYIGLPFDKSQTGSLNITKTSFLGKYKNPFAVVINMLRGLPSFYYHDWKKIIKKVDPDEYDLVYTDFSHHDFVIKWAKKHGLKVITRVHNIESDMNETVRKSKKFSHFKLRAMLNGKSVFRREKRTMELSDEIIFLTQNDLSRAQALYGENILSRSHIVPICIDISVPVEPVNPVGKQYVLATGSLSYGANAEGILWLVEKVWGNVCNKEEFADTYLLVAGANPSEELEAACNGVPRCLLVKNPPDIGIYFDSAQFYLAPIFSGAGMKVKVAEALLHGLKVVGTSHSLIGYESSADFTYQADTPEDFIGGMTEFIKSFSSADREDCRKNALEYYSVDCSIKAFGKIIDSNLQGEK